jgi:hypothetical protein
LRRPREVARAAATVEDSYAVARIVRDIDQWRPKNRTW